MKTHCKRGHLLSGSNLYVQPDGERQCRECHRIRQQKYVFAHLEETLAYKRAYYEANRERHHARVRAYDKENLLTHGNQNSSNEIGNQNEQVVAEFFRSLGFIYERQKQNAPFDGVVEGTFRIEVKSARFNKKTRTLSPTRYKREKSDLLIMVHPNGSLYLRPSNYLGIALLLSIHFNHEASQ